MYIHVHCPPKVLEQNQIFSHNFKKCFLGNVLNALYKQYESKIRPNETLGLIFDPYCLIPSISSCWKLIVLRGITWIMWLYKFCKFYKLSKNFWRALYLLYLKCVNHTKKSSKQLQTGLDTTTHFVPYKYVVVLWLSLYRISLFSYVLHV